VKLVAMTGKSDSTLARHADLVLDCAVAEEACPLNLAPTASTTAQMALAMRWPWHCWTHEDFAKRISRAATQAAAWAASC
jgi:DNA-binding MurR/RpiR family transcriptional regulator